MYATLLWTSQRFPKIFTETTSGLSMLLHDVISLTDETSNDKEMNPLKREICLKLYERWKQTQYESCAILHKFHNLSFPAIVTLKPSNYMYFKLFNC